MVEALIFSVLSGSKPRSYPSPKNEDMGREAGNRRKGHGGWGGSSEEGGHVAHRTDSDTCTGTGGTEHAVCRGSLQAIAPSGGP